MVNEYIAYVYTVCLIHSRESVKRIYYISGILSHLTYLFEVGCLLIKSLRKIDADTVKQPKLIDHSGLCVYHGKKGEHCREVCLECSTAIYSQFVHMSTAKVQQSSHRSLRVNKTRS